MTELFIFLFCVPILIWMCLLERSLAKHQEGTLLIIDEIKYLKRRIIQLENKP